MRIDIPQSIVDYVSPFYEQNDVAHRIDHAVEVTNLGVKLNAYLGMPYRRYVVIAACMSHDIGNAIGNRELHHESAYNHFIDYAENKQLIDFPYLVNRSEMIEIAYACLEHRASFKGEFSYPLSEIVSAADRGYPSFENLYRRLKKKDNFGYNTDKEICEHLKDKYTRHGYMRMPDVYKDYFVKDLPHFYDCVELFISQHLS